jgi:hypothetical protein
MQLPVVTDLSRDRPYARQRATGAGRIAQLFPALIDIMGQLPRHANGRAPASNVEEGLAVDLGDIDAANVTIDDDLCGRT